MFNWWNERELPDLVLAKLRRQLIRVYEQSPDFKARFDAAGVDPHAFRSMADLARYPFYDKDLERLSQERSRLELGHPFGLNIVCDPRRVIRVSSSSGTTGKPTYTGYTQADREVTTEIGRRMFEFIGGQRGDVVMHAFVLSMWIAGAPILDILQNYGATTVPIGAMTGARRFAQVAQDMRPIQANMTPSYARYLINKLPVEAGISAAELGIRRLQLGGEPGAGIPHVRQALSEGFGGAQIHDAIGHTHASFVTSVSCEEHAGMHFLGPDYVHLEVIDPKTLEILPWEDGVRGEIVVTALQKECAPAIRWREKDMVTIYTRPCACGKPGVRFTLQGRSDDMLLVRGVNVFPHAIQDVVESFAPAVTGEIRVVLHQTPPVAQPPLPVRVELAEVAQGGDELRHRIEQAIHDRLRFTARIEFVPAGTLSGRGATHKAQLIEHAYRKDV